jgi:hypothetical protein
MLGLQKGPATLGRIRAKWRQVHTESREAVVVRRQWMTLIGCDDDEIRESTENETDLCLQDELDCLCSAILLARK